VSRAPWKHGRLSGDDTYVVEFKGMAEDQEIARTGTAGGQRWQWTRNTSG
jgi:hypothetical protein